MTRVVVVDDEELFRSGLAELLGATPDLDVVGQAADGREAIAQVQAHHPDVVLLDVQMPVMNGLEALGELRRTAPTTAVVMLTSFQYDEYIVPALRAGAAGYLLKDSSADELRRGIRAAADGGAPMSPLALRRLLDVVGDRLDPAGSGAAALVAGLSEREREVLGCVAAGMTNGEIARHLYMAETTVKTHLAHSMTKLGVANRTQAAIVAHDARLPLPSA
ncbi:response regulator [Cellulomonas edaphi]|uniref:Response regulator transcription factor n=1 Tax=Cellulomonas edaphi TaxID=3053468 RepID=A0ABT7S5T5_9CELL|nr:response regulator transcription factor [Cellulomons edaphi]MDM7830985.1 response regulator transcription factor [Cellulomons edaphi]